MKFPSQRISLLAIARHLRFLALLLPFPFDDLRSRDFELERDRTGRATRLAVHAEHALTRLPRRLSIRVRDEIVTFGVPEEIQVDENGIVGGGTHLKPEEVNQLVNLMNMVKQYIKKEI